ncbi:MAG: hypothetical protein ACXABY_20225, partial [Candidatus Thorarchaeota archaeon]
YALIWQSPTQYELVYISTVTPTQLNLSQVVASTWTGTKTILPVHLSYIRPSHTRLESLADGNGYLAMTFVPTDYQGASGYSAPTTYQSIPVLTKATLEDGRQEFEIHGDMKTIDYGLGRFSMYSDSEFNIHIQGHLFRQVGKQECWEFKQLICSLKGRFGVVWIPTFKEDCVQIETIGSSDVSFEIETIGWSQNMQLNDLRTHLAFIFPDGSFLFREITAIEEVTDSLGITTTLITMDSSLGQAVQPGDCEISFLDKCRLSEDEVTTEFDEPFRNYCKTTFTRVEA